MWNDDDRKWLYEKMKSNGIDTGSYDDFTTSLNNQEDRDWYYQKSVDMGLDVGSADDFMKMMVEPQESAQPQAPVQAPAQTTIKPAEGQAPSDAVREEYADTIMGDGEIIPGEKMETTQPDEAYNERMRGYQAGAEIGAKAASTTVANAKKNAPKEAPLQTATEVKPSAEPKGTVTPTQRYLIIKGKKTPVTEDVYQDFMRRHPSGRSNDKAQSTPQQGRNVMTANEIINNAPWMRKNAGDNKAVNEEWKAARQKLNEETSHLLQPKKGSELSWKMQANAMRRMDAAEYERKARGEDFDNTDNNFETFYQSSVAPSFKTERARADAEGSKAAAQYPSVTDARGMTVPNVMAAAAYEKATDPAVVTQNVIANLDGNALSQYVERRMHVDEQPTTGGIERQLTDDEMQLVRDLIAAENGDVVSKLQQRMYQDYINEGGNMTTAGYILGNGFRNSLLMRLQDAIVTRIAGSSGLRKQFLDMAYQRAGERAGAIARGVSGAVTMIADAPAFGVAGKVAAPIAKGLIGTAGKAIAGRAAGELGAAAAERFIVANSRLGRVAENMVQSGLTFSGYDVMSEGVNQFQQGQFDAGELVNRAIKGFGTGAAVGVLGGATGELTKELTGVARGTGKALGFAAEVGLFTGMQGLEMASELGIPITDVDWGALTIENAAMLGVLKLQSMPFRARMAKDVDLALNEYDIEELRRRGYDFGSVSEGLRSLKTINSGGEVNYTDKSGKPYSAGEQRKVNAMYAKFLADKDIPIDVKRKVRFYLEGEFTPYEPVFGMSEVQMGNGGTATFETYSADGSVISREHFANVAEAEGRRAELMDQVAVNQLSAYMKLAEHPLSNIHKMANMEAKGNAERERLWDIIDRASRGEELTQEEADIYLELYNNAADYGIRTSAEIFNGVAKNVLRSTGIDVQRLLADKTRKAVDWTPEEREAVHTYLDEIGRTLELRGAFAEMQLRGSQEGAKVRIEGVPEEPIDEGIAPQDGGGVPPETVEQAGAEYNNALSRLLALDGGIEMRNRIDGLLNVENSVDEEFVSEFIGSYGALGEELYNACMDYVKAEAKRRAVEAKAQQAADDIQKGYGEAFEPAVNEDGRLTMGVYDGQSVVIKNWDNESDLVKVLDAQENETTVRKADIENVNLGMPFDEWVRMNTADRVQTIFNNINIAYQPQESVGGGLGMPQEVNGEGGAKPAEDGGPSVPPNGEIPLMGDNSPTPPTEPENIAPTEPQQPRTEGGMPLYEEGGKMKPDFKNATSEETYNYLYGERKMQRDDINAFVRNKVSDAEKRLRKLEGKRPKMGTDLDEFEEKMQQWEQDKADTKKELDYWNDVQQRAKQENLDEQRENADLASQRTKIGALGDAVSLHEYLMRQVYGGLKFIWEDGENGTKGLGSHLGLGNGAEKRSRRWLIGKKEDGAMYPEQAAEMLVDRYNAETGQEVSYDDVFNTLNDILLRHDRKSDLGNDILKEHDAGQFNEDEFNKEDERRQKDAWAVEHGFTDFDSAEDYMKSLEGTEQPQEEEKNGLDGLDGLDLNEPTDLEKPQEPQAKEEKVIEPETPAAEPHGTVENEPKEKVEEPTEPKEEAPKDAVVLEDPSTWVGKTFFTNGMRLKCTDVDNGYARFDNLDTFMGMGFDVPTVQRYLRNGEWGVLDETPKQAEQPQEEKGAFNPIEEAKKNVEKKGTGKTSANGEKKEEKQDEPKSKWVDDEDADEFEEIRRKLRQKFGSQLNSGLDPEALQLSIRMAYLLMKHGVRKFADFAKQVIDAIGEGVRPHLKSIYAAAYFDPSFKDFRDEMTPLSEVEKFDVDNFDKKPKEEKALTDEWHYYVTWDKSTGRVTLYRESRDAIPVGDGRFHISAKNAEELRGILKNNGMEAILNEADVHNPLAASEIHDYGKPSENNGEKGDENVGNDVSLQKSDKEKREAFTNAVASDLEEALLWNDEKPYKSIVDVRKRARDVGMKVDEDGRTDILLQELVENGLVRAARKVVTDSRSKNLSRKEIYDTICQLYNLQPTITLRSSNRIKMQQYSTPLPMSFVAQMFIDAGEHTEGEIGLEPTAGNGMLVFATPAERLHVNELDETRLENLQGQGFKQVTNQDATQPFEGGRKYDFVIMNPPFGSSEAKEYDGKKISGLDPQITLNALESMKDDGKAAIIIGGNMEYGDNGAIKGNKAFFTYLYDHYNVKGIVDMDGSLYKKQGTTYPTRMILIDGRRSEEERAQTTVYPPVQSKAIPVVKIEQELYDTVEGLINSKEKTNGTEVLQGQNWKSLFDTDNTQGSVEQGGRTEQPGKNDSPKQQGQRTETEPKGNSGSSQPVSGGQSGQNYGNGKLESGNTGASGNGGSRGNTGNDVRGLGAVGTSNRGNGLSNQKEKEDRPNSDNRLSYRPHNTSLSLESVAPAAMVESMDKAVKEVEQKHGNIDEFVTKELGYDSIEEMHHALAAEQVDSVAMAIHQMMQGQALVIGDQTGVGKGRQMAALIRWAVKQGKKPIFFTQKADLFTDIYRDLIDVGSGDLRPFIFNSDGTIVDAKGKPVYKPMSASAQKEVFASGKVPDGYDFVVLTYSQVNTGDAISVEEQIEAAKKNGARVSKKKLEKMRPTPKATFLRAIAEDNYLLLDESHTAAGSGNTGGYLQSIMRNAKGATFASATFAKRPDTMPLYAIRTAMSKANVEPEKLIAIIERGGVTLQEIMSRALTNAGQMVRRERDMGDVVTDWKTVDDEETVKRARENYDKTIAAFNAIIQFQNTYVKPKVEEIDSELSIMAGSSDIKQGTDQMGVSNVPFASKTYNYTKQLMLALKVNAIVDEVDAQIKSGKHPVIALESTMESSLNEYAINEEIEEPTFSASLLRGLRTVMQYTIKDADGNEIHSTFSPSELGPAAEKAYEELENFIRESTQGIFISPLDAIIDKLHEKGYKVGELTGRNVYVEQTSDGKSFVRRRTDKDKKRMQREFNDGTLDVLILNKSASTGISLHASSKFTDQRQRCMVIAQPLSDINDYMQMIGRTDRTGQVSRCYYVNLGLPVPAESRFLMMLSGKLKSLNANTTTSQDSESNEVQAPDLLNKYGSQVVVEYLRDNPEIYEKMGEPLRANNERVSVSKLDEYEPQEGDARKITGYVALLTTKEQEDFYIDVVGRYNSLIQYLNDIGANDLHITVMPLRAKTLEKKVSSEGVDPNGENPFAQNAYLEKVEMDVLRKPMKSEEVHKLIEQVNNGQDGNAHREHIMEIVRSENDKKRETEEERYQRDLAKREEDLEKQIAKINASTKRTEEEKREAIERLKNDTLAAVEERHTRNTVRIDDAVTSMEQELSRMKVGDTFLIPDVLDSMIFSTSSPAIFCGYKAKESKITPSTTFAVFAVLDGRRKIEVKLSEYNVLRQIERVTDENYDAAHQTTLDNWDSSIPTGTRKEGYILTGNIIQAVSDSQNDRGGFTGQLISFTDEEGNVRDGILMPDNWNAGMLRNSGVPINARAADLKRGVDLKSTDGKVKVEKNYGYYSLSVPKTKKEGGKYFENEELLSLVTGNNFYPYRGQLRGDISVEDIDDVLTILSNLGVRVEKAEDEGDARFREGVETGAESRGDLGYTQRQVVRYREREGRRMRERVVDMSEKMHISDKVVIHDTADGLKGRYATAKGWFDPKTGKVHVVVGNHRNVFDVMMTMMHEGVAHYGLRKMCGEHFDAFLDDVFANADESIKSAIRDKMDSMRNKDKNKKSEETYRRAATEEYMADVAEEMEFSDAPPFTEPEIQKSWWSKIKDLFLEMWGKLGLGKYMGPTITESEVRYILWRSWQNMVNPGRYRNPFAVEEERAKAEPSRTEEMVAKAEPSRTEKGDVLVAAAPEMVEPKRVADNRFVSTSNGDEFSFEQKTKMLDAYNQVRDKHGAMALLNTPNGYVLINKDAKAVRSMFGVDNAPFVVIDKEGLDEVLPRLIRAGHRVAIVDVMTDNKVSEDDVDVLFRDGEETKQSAVEQLATKLGVKVNIVDDVNAITHGNKKQQERRRNAKGWYNTSTGEVTIVLPNNRNVDDVVATTLHEVVAHKGLREMVGEERYNEFLDEIYSHLKKDLKEKVDKDAFNMFTSGLGKSKDTMKEHRRVAVDELLGRLAEKGFDDFTESEKSIWQRLKEAVLKVLDKFLDTLKLPKWFELGDNELRYMLWRSKERMERGKESPLDMAKDNIKRRELGLNDGDLYRTTETDDIWNDNSLSMSEKIASVKVRLAQNQSDNKTLRNEALQQLGTSLSDLRKAMRLQRDFDQSTVKRVSDLARIMMKGGYLRGLGTSDFDSILAAVKNSVGHDNVEGAVQRLMDIMIDNQLKNAEKVLKALETIKGKKVNESGVEVIGELDPRGQRMMEVFKKVRRWKPEDIEDAIDNAINRMGSDDNSVAEEAANEYAGLMLAQNYVDTIIASEVEEANLRKEIKEAHDNASESDRRTPAYSDLIRTLNDAIRQNKIERAQAYIDLAQRMGADLKQSIENAKDFKDLEKMRINEIHHNANSDMEGRPAKEHYKPKFMDKFVNNAFVQFLFAPLSTFEQMMRLFGRKSADGEGYLYNRYMRGWVDARQKEIKGVREKFAILDDKAKELFGGKVKSWGDLIRYVGKLPKGEVVFKNGGNEETYTMTQGNLLYIYMIDKMLDGQMKLRKMGITEADVEKIADNIDSRLLALGDWLQNEFLVDCRNEYNETHKRVFGASMAAIENYFPLKILKNALNDKAEDLDKPQYADGITTITGSIIKRKRNTNPIDIFNADALNLILEHVATMEHWNAFTEFNRDLNTLRTYKRFRNQVINMTTIYGSGKELWDKFNNVCQMAAGTYKPPRAKFDEAAVNFAKGVTASKVSFRLYTAIKQLASMPAYIPDTRVDFLLKNIVMPKSAWDWSMENLPIFNERWKSRLSGNPRLLKSDMDWRMWRTRIVELASRVGMSPNAFVDAVTVSIGAHAIYETRYNRYMKEGYESEVAHKKAIQDAEIAYNLTQQSSEGAFTSTIQVDRSWLSVLFSIFRNASMSYQRQLHNSLRNFKNNLGTVGKEQSIEFMTKQFVREGMDADTAEANARRRYNRQMLRDALSVATFGCIMQLCWNIFKYLPYLLMGDDDNEKDKMWDDIIAQTTAGSIEGLSGGDVYSELTRMAITGEGSPAHASKDMPITSDATYMLEKIWQGKSDEALSDLVNIIISSGVGVNPQTITDAVLAIMDACGNDPALAHEATLFAFRVLQVPQSQIDKLYFDEVGLSGEEASKYSMEELAERYARYKVKRGRFFTPWSWDDEEALGKQKKKALKSIKERAERLGVSGLNDKWAEYEEKYKAVADEVKAAKEVGKKNDKQGEKMLDAIYNDKEKMRLYDTFKGLDSSLDDLVKRYMEAINEDEADLYHKTIEDYKRLAVKVLESTDSVSEEKNYKELDEMLEKALRELDKIQGN